MKHLVPVWTGVALFLLSSVRAPAWSSAGHQVIAAEAYRQLPPALKAKANEILKAHPDYEKWRDSFTGGSAGLDLETFVFMRASMWPDEIHHHGNPYDHPAWHFVDYPLKPALFPVEPGPEPNNDALYGIIQAEKALTDAKTSPEERAVFLSWLIHLVGDKHQPLHCGTLFNSAFPNVDKGGNDFYVKPGARGVRLHSVWDGLLGTSGKLQTRPHKPSYFGA